MNNITSGNVKKQIIIYAIPLIFSTIFMELYNITNSMIVGNFISLHALSAVSSCTWICNIFNYTFSGIGLGTGVLLGGYFGAKDKENIKKTVDTALVFAIVGGIIVTIISELLLPNIMRLCNISDDLFLDAYKYLRVYMLGATFVLTYQICFNILKSLGDSKSPLMYLILSSLTNLALGILFIRVMHLSIEATAFATICSQFVTIVCSFIKMVSYDEIGFDIKNIDFSFEIVGKICAIGIPASIQNLLIAFSSMMVQSYTNTFPNEVISGIGVAEKVGNWTQMPSLALSNSGVVFISQNIGAKKYDRVKEIIRSLIWMSTLVTLLTCFAIYSLAPTLVGLFNSDPEVIYHGTKMTRILAISFISLNYSHLFNGANRAAKNVKAPMIIAVFAQCVCKYLFVYIGLKINYSVNVLYYGSAFGFTLAGILATIYFFCFNKTKELHLR